MMHIDMLYIWLYILQHIWDFCSLTVNIYMNSFPCMKDMHIHYMHFWKSAPSCCFRTQNASSWACLTLWSIYMNSAHVQSVQGKWGCETLRPVTCPLRASPFNFVFACSSHLSLENQHQCSRTMTSSCQETNEPYDWIRECHALKSAGEREFNKYLSEWMRTINRIKQFLFS